MDTQIVNDGTTSDETRIEVSVTNEDMIDILMMGIGKALKEEGVHYANIMPMFELGIAAFKEQGRALKEAPDESIQKIASILNVEIL